MRKSHCLQAVLIWSWAVYSCHLFVPTPVQAIIPPSMSDEELAEQPIVVVGRWNKAVPLTPHELVSGNELMKSETHTELIVERVLKGDIKAGSHKLLLEMFLAWEEKGGPIIAYYSSQMIGDVDDVAKPNLWFLSRKRSWDAADKHEYLCLQTYCGIQPLVLEDYFQALMSDDPAGKMAGVFRSRQPLVVERCLQFAAGKAEPWPLRLPDDFPQFRADRGGHRIVELAPEVEKLLNEPAAPLRPLAAAVWAELAGAKGIPRLRTLIEDKDPRVRAAAIALLVRERDANSYAAICEHVNGIDDGLLGCAIVEAVAKTNDERLTPVLIELLQSDDFSFRLGDNWGIPAFKAQQALTKIVGYTFPFDTKAGLKAWNEAKGIRDSKERQEFLAKALPLTPQPVTASYSVEDKHFVVLLTNSSTEPVVLSKSPTNLEIVARGHSSWTFDGVKDASSFVTLAPGESTRFAEVKVDESVLSGTIGKVVLWYTRNGNEYGINAWIGKVEARPATRDR